MIGDDEDVGVVDDDETEEEALEVVDVKEDDLFEGAIDTGKAKEVEMSM